MSTTASAAEDVSADTERLTIEQPQAVTAPRQRPVNFPQRCAKALMLGLPVAVAVMMLGDRLVALVASDGGARLLVHSALVVYYLLWARDTYCDSEAEARLAAVVGGTRRARPIAKSLVTCIAAVAVVMAAQGVRMSVLVAAGLWAATLVRRRRLSAVLASAKKTAPSIRRSDASIPFARRPRHFEGHPLGYGPTWSLLMGAVTIGLVVSACFLPLGGWLAEMLGLASWRSVAALGMLGHVIVTEGAVTLERLRWEFHAPLDQIPPKEQASLGPVA